MIEKRKENERKNPNYFKSNGPATLSSGLNHCPKSRSKFISPASVLNTEEGSKSSESDDATDCKNSLLKIMSAPGAVDCGWFMEEDVGLPNIDEGDGAVMLEDDTVTGVAGALFPCPGLPVLGAPGPCPGPPLGAFRGDPSG